MNARDLGLDYFLLYDTELRPRVRRSVALKGQLDRTPIKGDLVELRKLAVVTEKNREPMADRFAHLTCYRLLERSREPTREVVVENQFGTQTFLIGNAADLLVPAEKVERGSRLPQGLDHFKVYVARSAEPLRREVHLRDQFGDRETLLDTVVAFAVPVEKNRGRETAPIRNAKAHLVIFRIRPWVVKRSVRARDQFGSYDLGQSLRAAHLAVPSVKLKWSRGE